MDARRFGVGSRNLQLRQRCHWIASRDTGMIDNLAKF
jgi:hypothetical protein